MLEIIGIIAIGIVLKFVYDTYLTNNTEEEWQKYKVKNPIDAHMLEMEEKKLDIEEAKRQYILSIEYFNTDQKKSRKAIKKAIKLDPENTIYRNRLKMIPHERENTNKKSESDNSNISKKFVLLVGLFKNNPQNQILIDSDKEFLFETSKEEDFNPFMNQRVERYYQIQIIIEKKKYYLITIEFYKAGNKISKSYSPKINIEPNKAKEEYLEILEKSYNSIIK